LRAVGPSLLSLTRQAVPLVCKDEREENLCALGAYILQESRHFPRIDVTCFATGSEVAIALETAAILADQNIGCRVVSVPCQERFWQQESEYIQSLLCNKSLKVAIEAGVQQSWDKWIGPHGIFIGMTGFGASAPAEELYKHFGITAERVVQRVITAVKGKGNGTDCD
jgi:transketolase